MMGWTPNSKHQEGVGSYSVMEDLEVVHDTNRGVGQQYEEDNADVTDISTCGQGGGRFHQA